ncbi:hypothetical protein CapIbe_017843 [Capra ibex]
MCAGYCYVFVVNRQFGHRVRPLHVHTTVLALRCAVSDAKAIVPAFLRGDRALLIKQKTSTSIPIKRKTAYKIHNNTKRGSSSRGQTHVSCICCTDSFI